MLLLDVIRSRIDQLNQRCPIKSFFASAIVAAALVSGSAMAADLPMRDPAPAPVMAAPIFTWTGFYVGLNAGYSRTRADFDSSVVNPNGFAAASVIFVNAMADGSASKGGFTGGVQIGYNWQFAPAWVFGLEADINGLSQAASLTAAGTTPGGTVITNFTNSLKSEWIATVRGRLGYTFDRSMIYATGGLAVLGSRYAQTFIATLPINSFTSKRSATAGWTVGGGWEYALTSNWSVKAEYLYSRFDRINGNVSAPLVAGFTDAITGTARKIELHQARLGLNYRFGSPASGVVAKY